MAYGTLLERLTWEEASDWFRRDPVMLIPVGAAAKEHGPHLPLGTDRLVVEALALDLIDLCPIMVAPTVTYGPFPAFADFPGSQSISAQTFMALMHDILERFIAQGLRRFAILNGGVTTADPLTIVVHEIFAKTGIRIAIADIARLGRRVKDGLEQWGGGHADQAETSMMLAIAPDLVHLERAVVEEVRPFPQGMRPPPPLPGAGVFRVPMRMSLAPGADPRDRTLRGASGDPTLATAVIGTNLREEMVAELYAGLCFLYPDLADCKS